MTKTSGEVYTQKKTYNKPSLKEWGTLTMLTQGGQQGLQDDPFPGGTEPAFMPPSFGPKTN